MSRADFYTDFGRSIPVTDADGNPLPSLPRYAAWGDAGRGKPEVIDTGDDLDALRLLYGDLRVLPIGGQR